MGAERRGKHLRGDTGKRGKENHTHTQNTLLSRLGCGSWGPSPAQPLPAFLWPPQGFTAIHFAAQSGQLACLQVLVEEYKFPVDLPTNSGQTALHLVIHGDNKSMALPCIHYLLKQGADINP